MQTLDPLAQLQIRADQWIATQMLATMREKSPQAVLEVAITTHVHGRLAIDASKPARHEARELPTVKSQGRSIVEISLDPKLATDVKQLADRLGQASRDVIVCALDHYLFGEVGELEIPEDGAGASSDWRRDIDSVSVWIPDRVLGALDGLCERLDLNRSDVVRNALFAGLFGRLSLERAIRCGWWTVSRRNADGIMTIQFSEQPNPELVASRTAFVKHFGKSVESVKVWLPRPLKLAMLNLANRRAIRLSELTRRMLCLSLLGRLSFDALPIESQIAPQGAEED